MARGAQKIQAQQKAAAKKSAGAKSHSKADAQAAAAKALKYTCSVCKLPMTDLNVYRNHFDSKHSKSPKPAELA
eukprot:m.289126 g.289126  ORF g.289126 m.289126 type:complete len:74 (-) comp12078_c0_seq1:70-291(-)